MTFEQDYPKLLKIAKAKSNIYKTDIDPSEILSDLYIKFFSEHGFKYSLEFFEKEIFKYCANYNNTKTIFVQLGKENDIQPVLIAECTCSVCKEVKPAACFPIIIFKNGKKFQQIRCEDCLKKVNHKHFKTYIKNNKEKWNGYIKDRYEISKKELSDVYIRRLLRSKYTTAHLFKNPHLVTQKRKQLLEKRQLKKVH